MAAKRNGVHSAEAETPGDTVKAMPPDGRNNQCLIQEVKAATRIGSEEMILFRNRPEQEREMNG